MKHYPVMIALGGDEKFAMPMAVTIFSLLKNISQELTPTLFLLNGGISLETRSRIERSARSAQGNVNLEWVDVDMSRLSKFPITSHPSLSTYIRLLLPELLPEHIELLLYIDTDTLVQGDVSPLFSEKMMEHSLWAAAESNFPKRIQDHPHLLSLPLGLQPESIYFNAGVLLLNMPSIRSENCFQKAFDFLDQYPKYATWADQDALNAAFHREWGKLSWVWNAQNFFQTSDIPEDALQGERPTDMATLYKEACIFHFKGSKKPWNSGISYPPARLYRRYLKECGWFTNKQYREWRIGWMREASLIMTHKITGALKRRISPRGGSVPRQEAP